MLSTQHGFLKPSVALSHPGPLPFYVFMVYSCADMSKQTKRYGKDGAGKLVRHKVITQLEERGIKVEWRIATTEEKVLFLADKFVEEMERMLAEEWGMFHWRTEIADMTEVVAALTGCAIANHLQIPYYDAARYTKDYPYDTLEERMAIASQELLQASPYSDSWLLKVAELSNIINRITQVEGAHSIQKATEDKALLKGDFKAGHVLVSTTEEENRESVEEGVVAQEVVEEELVRA